MQHLRDKGVSTKQRQIVNILSTMLNELITAMCIASRAAVRIVNFKCQRPSSCIFNIEIRQPKEYLLVSAISNSDTRGERERERERERKENLTYPSVGTPDHKEAFQRSLCMCKAPVSVRRAFFQSTCFFNFKKIRQFLREMLLHPSFT